MAAKNAEWYIQKIITETQEYIRECVHRSSEIIDLRKHHKNEPLTIENTEEKLKQYIASRDLINSWHISNGILVEGVEYGASSAAKKLLGEGYATNPMTGNPSKDYTNALNALTALIIDEVEKHQAPYRIEHIPLAETALRELGILNKDIHKIYIERQKSQTKER